MDIRKLWNILLLLSLSCALQAADITGKVLDNTTRQALDFVNVSVAKQGDATPITGTVTDEEGVFALTNIKNGKYTLTVSFMGYTPLTKAVEIKANQNVDLGRLFLKEDTQNLEEVEVVGQGSTMRFELDKKIFTVGNDITSSGASVSEVLENIPSVDVDQEGNISLRNSEDVEIWINGKPAGLNSDNRADILRQMPAESIKQIELITNPSAKYSPEGTAGIINLVMKEDRKAGYYGSVNAGIEYGLAEPWTVPPGANAGFNINFNAGPVDGYFNAGYRFHTSNGGSNSERLNLKGTGIEDTTKIADADKVSRLTKNGQNDMRDHGMFFRAGLNFRLAEHSTLGVSGFAMASDPKALRGHSVNNSDYLLTGYPNFDTIRYYNRVQEGYNWHPGGQAQLDYTFKLRGHQLMFTGQYRNFTWNQDRYYTQIEAGKDSTREEQSSLNTNQTADFALDYEWKPDAKSRLEAGFKATITWSQSLAQAYNGHNKEQEIYRYYTSFGGREQNYALYITYGNRFWDKLSIQVGLRGEYFMRHLNSTYKDDAGVEQDAYAQKDNKRDTAYFQLFPSAYISYNFGHGHELQLNYTRRVDRPRGHQINPRIDFSDSTNITYGNPDLLPSYSSSLELNYLKTWERHTLSAGVFWRYRDGIVQNVKYMDGDVMKNTFINVSKRQDLGVEVVAKNRLFKDILQLTTSANFYWNTITAAEYHSFVNGEPIDVTLPSQSILAWSARINAQFMFTKTFSGQISARYRSPRVVAQGSTTHSYSIDLGLRKSFLDRRLILAFNVRDILDSRARRTTNWGDGFWQKQENRWHSRTVSLTLTYNFGTNQNKKKGPDGNMDMDMTSSYDESFGGMDE